MAPRGRKKKAGLMREDAARDAMRDYGFEERVIKEAIKELVELYGEGGWFLIEEGRYEVLLTSCLEKQEAQARQLAEQHNQEAQARQLAEQHNQEAHARQLADQHNQEAVQEEEEEVRDQHGEEGRDQVGSNSTSLVGSGAETGTPQTCLTDALSITSEAVVESAPAASQTADYAHHSVGGSQNSHCGWLSSEEEETDPNEDVDENDDEMIHLTPEPLCEELEELLREVVGQKKRKRAT